MAQGLFIEGVPVRVRKDTWIQAESLYQGPRERMSENNLFDGSYGEARVWNAELYFISATEESVIRLACPRGQTVMISGELPGGDVNVIVDIGATRLLKKLISGVQVLHRIMPVHIEEVIEVV